MSKRTAQQKSNTFTRLSRGDNRLAITSKLTKPGLVWEDFMSAASSYRISGDGALPLGGPGCCDVNMASSRAVLYATSYGRALRSVVWYQPHGMTALGAPRFDLKISHSLERYARAFNTINHVCDRRCTSAIHMCLPHVR